MNRNRLKLGLCARMALWTAASGMLAQSLGAKQEAPGTRAPAWRTPKQKQAAATQQRSARFLARRGIGAGGRGIGAMQLVYPRSPAEMLAEARAQHRALAKQANPANTSLTAPWQPVGPAQVTTAIFGALTGRVSSIAVDPSDASGNTVYVGATGGGVWKSANAAGDLTAAVSLR